MDGQGTCAGNWGEVFRVTGKEGKGIREWESRKEGIRVTIVATWKVAKYKREIAKNKKGGVQNYNLKLIILFNKSIITYLHTKASKVNEGVGAEVAEG